MEDHATEYIRFAGTPPEGEDGAGEVKIRDAGTFVPLVRDRDRIEIVFHGRELHGKYNLFRSRKGGENAWLIVKSRQ